MKMKRELADLLRKFGVTPLAFTAPALLPPITDGVVSEEFVRRRHRLIPNG